MKQAITRSFTYMMAFQLENTPNADDLDMVIEAYTHALNDGLFTADQIERRFKIWMNNESRWPTPADIRKMKVSDYVPTLNTGQAQISNDSRRLPLRSEAVTAGEYAAEHLKRMREALK